MANTDDYLLPEGERPVWLSYPMQLVDLARGGRAKLSPWRLYEVTAVRWDSVRLKDRTGRDLVPFAYLGDGECLACFERGRGQEVVIIRDGSEAGSRDERKYVNFVEWLRGTVAQPAGRKGEKGDRRKRGHSTFPPLALSFGVCRAGSS